MTRLTLPLWRSLLYVPAYNTAFIAKAAGRGADAIILDLEDGTPPHHKASARTELAGAAERLQAQGASVLVRVNRPWPLAWRDLEAAVAAKAAAILLPKVDEAASIRVIDTFLEELEADAGLPLKVPVIPILESAKGVLNAFDILSASTRVVAVIPGNEDLAADLGIDPAPEQLVHTHSQIVLAARAAGVAVLGLIGSGANFHELSVYESRAQLARTWGFQGATCIHPAQISILNSVFSPTPAELEWALATVAALEASGGAPIQKEGQMIDRPIYLRARHIIDHSAENS